MSNQNRRVLRSLHKTGNPPPKIVPALPIAIQVPPVKTSRIIKRRSAVRPGHIRPLPIATPIKPTDPLANPLYYPKTDTGSLHMLALRSFSRHMTDEGWQLQEGLRGAGYRLWGKGYPDAVANVRAILDCVEREEGTPIKTVIVQDKREWDPSRDGCLDKEAAFMGCDALADRGDIFKLTVCKDAHQSPDYHAGAAKEIGCHAWIIYYHPQSVLRMAPYLRPEHVIRTYHTLDSGIVPEFSAANRRPCLLSGRVSAEVYPLRHRVARYATYLPDIEVHAHPGYHAAGSETPDYLFLLSQYKVAICTSSIYGYALRKIIEATAAGCAVLTDLPDYDVLPHIDGNLIRISPQITLGQLQKLVRETVADYDPEKQENYAREARNWYDYRRQGELLATNIESLRKNYNAVKAPANY